MADGYRRYIYISFGFEEVNVFTTIFCDAIVFAVCEKDSASVYSAAYLNSSRYHRTFIGRYEMPQD